MVGEAHAADNDKTKQAIKDIAQNQTWYSAEGYEYVGATPSALADVQMVLSSKMNPLVCYWTLAGLFFVWIS